MDQIYQYNIGGVVYQLDHTAQTVSKQQADGTFTNCGNGGSYLQFCQTILSYAKIAWIESLVAGNSFPSIVDMNSNTDVILSAETPPVVQLQI